MRRVTTLLSVVAIGVLAATAAQAQTGNPGWVLLIGGGTMSLDTGSGPQLIPDRWDDGLGLDSDHSADINVEVLAGMDPGNLQHLIGAYDGPTFSSIFLLSNSNPNFDMIPNSAWWDMTFGGPAGLWMDPVETAYTVPGSAGWAYFRMRAWTGLYNSYQDAYNASAAGQAVYVADTGVYVGVTCPGGISPIPTMTQPDMILEAVSVPEPLAILLTATGLVGLMAYAWRKRK